MLKCSDDDKYFTQTREGKIPHLNAKIGSYDMCMPVKLKPDSRGCPMPVKDNHGYIYALPDGLQINLEGTISR